MKPTNCLNIKCPNLKITYGDEGTNHYECLKDYESEDDCTQKFIDNILDNKERIILKVLVGSRAHGLANEDSDKDYRGVFLIPTKELLKINAPKVTTNWKEGDTKQAEDNTMWELGHFLNLATHCNPTILEVFCAPIVDTTDIGTSLRKQFPRVWNSKGVRDAFIGYGLNQRKKFLDKKDTRPDKYATAYLRTLIQAYYLLTFRTLIVDMSKADDFEILKRFKAGQYEVGEVIQKCYEWETMVNVAYEHNQDKTTDLDQLNAWLIKIRKGNWD